MKTSMKNDNDITHKGCWAKMWLAVKNWCGGRGSDFSLDGSRGARLLLLHRTEQAGLGHVPARESVRAARRQNRVVLSRVRRDASRAGTS